MQEQLLVSTMCRLMWPASSDFLLLQSAERREESHCGSAMTHPARPDLNTKAEQGAASMLHPHSHSPSDRPMSEHATNIWYICRVKGRRMNSFNLVTTRVVVFKPSCLQNACFSQMCGPVPLLSVTVNQRQQEELGGCHLLSFSNPSVLMGGQCDQALLFVLHNYCV